MTPHLKDWHIIFRSHGPFDPSLLNSIWASDTWGMTTPWHCSLRHVTQHTGQHLLSRMTPPTTPSPLFQGKESCIHGTQGSIYLSCIWSPTQDHKIIIYIFFYNNKTTNCGLHNSIFVLTICIDNKQCQSQKYIRSTRWNCFAKYLFCGHICQLASKICLTDHEFI